MGMNRVRVAMDSMNMVTMKNSSRIMMRMTVGLVEKPSMVLAIHLSKPAVVSMTVYSLACDLMDIKVGDVLPTLLPFIGATVVCIALMIAFW